MKAQVSRQYARIRRDHALEIARQEAAKSKNKSAGTIISAPPLPEPEAEQEEVHEQDRSHDQSSDEREESDLVAPAKNRDKKDGNTDSAEDDQPSEPSQKGQKSQTQQQRKKAPESLDSPVQSHDNSAGLARAKNSYLSKAAQKARRRGQSLFLRHQERQLAEETRQEALARRTHMRKLWQKAARPGADGKRRLGRQAPVLLEKARRLMG